MCISGTAGYYRESKQGLIMETVIFEKRPKKVSGILQSYSNQDNIVLTQTQKYISGEQDRKPRDKPMHQIGRAHV